MRLREFHCMYPSVVVLVSWVNLDRENPLCLAVFLPRNSCTAALLTLPSSWPWLVDFILVVMTCFHQSPSGYTRSSTGVIPVSFVHYSYSNSTLFRLPPLCCLPPPSTLWVCTAVQPRICSCCSVSRHFLLERAPFGASVILESSNGTSHDLFHFTSLAKAVHQ